MISIVIPAYNEEKYIESLLKSIMSQKTGCEIIIADSSIDSTGRIARKFGCKVVRGGSPGRARNNGAKAARNDLLFLDADVVLPAGFLKRFLKKAKELDYASCRVEPLSGNMHHRFYYMLKNIGNYLPRLWTGRASGQCFFIRKKVFEKVNGFDETLVMGEEHELAARLKKFKGRFFMDIFVFNHPRRLEKEGTYRTLAKDIYSEIYRAFKPARHEIYRKSYGHY
jgi:glycosyltransferase involved in cell wall biosynthesis